MKIAKDKKLHIYFGALIGFLVSLVFSSNGTGFDEPLRGLVVGFGVATLVGIAKELLYDKLLGRGTPEVLDAVFTSIGALISTGILYLILILLK